MGPRRARRAMMVGAAFVVGLALGALLLSDGSPVPIGGASPLRVELASTGGNDAAATISVSYATGGGIEQWSLQLAGGETATRELERPPAGQLAVRVTVDWESAVDGGHGETTKLAEPSSCSGGEPLVVRFSVDTTRGVSFGRTTSSCGE